MQRSTRAHASIACAALLLLSIAVPRAAASQSSPPAQQGAIPTPESVLGFTVGADYKLATYDESMNYFQKLAAASNRIKLVDVGKTSTGHAWTLAIISSPENLAKLDHYRDIAQKLAHPEGLTDDQAHALAHEGRAFVDISGGLHASEIAGSQHTIQLAYDILAHPDDPKIKAILDNDVLFLWPSINPDGQNIVVNWYRENVGTPYEVSPLHELYQKYLGHDNNRDAYMLNVVESRVVARTWRQWEPTVIYVQHQTAPFPTRIWLPPFAEPIANHVNALMSREVNTIGMTIAQELETNGQVGATHMGTGFDAWYPGYIDYMPMLQNIASFWTETALYQYATPHFYTIRDFPKEYQDLRPQSLYPSPWPGGWWRLKDAVDYMRTASMAVLDYASKYREELLWNRYQAGRNAINKYSQNPPYAYI
ncbi:MAG: M14 family zinc carboxypeptidase, partial [Gemmatimonadaceae bacterium]